MARSRRLIPAGLAVGLALMLASGPATAGGPTPARGDRGAQAYSFAVLGDVPYGPTQVAGFPRLIAQINADPDVSLVNHLGDIKNGSSVCSDAYFAQIRSAFDTFRDPLVYTPGDNEWTDCHRPSNGAYDPLERLATIREMFFAEPGRTLGQASRRVRTQAVQGFPENVRYQRADVAFAAVHIVGSNNGLAPWTGTTAATPAQTAEVLGRTAAAVGLIRETFAAARGQDRRAVVLLTQADMFDPTVTDPKFANYYAFAPIVAAIAQESRRFDGPVYLFNGDSHAYTSDRPLSAGSPWLDFYGLRRPAGNLSRVTVDGADNATNYLKVTVHPRGSRVLTWTRVPRSS